MKTLTTLAAVAALIAGISIASARRHDGQERRDGRSSHVTGSGKFCIKGAGGALNCEYASLASCQKATKGSENCEARPSSTTGSKY